jgi:MinD superfamily P-loop ATPase
MHSLRIAIASGKGGTGKTLVATNMFYSLQQAGLNVALTDCDAEEPNANIFFDAPRLTSTSVTHKVPQIDTEKCTFCSRCHDYCSYNAIFIVPQLKLIQVMGDLCHSCGACIVACRDGAISEKDVELGKVEIYRMNDHARIIESRMRTGTMSPVKVIRQAIKESEDTEIVIMDAPPGTSCPFIHTVNAADFVVLVTEPTPFGLSNLQQAVETLKTMHLPYGVIINRSGRDENSIYQYLNEEKIPLLMEIPFDREIAITYSNGELISANTERYQRAFYGLYEYIESNYGNSHHQR